MEIVSSRVFFVAHGVFFVGAKTVQNHSFGGREVEAMVSYAWDLIKKTGESFGGRIQNYVQQWKENGVKWHEGLFIIPIGSMYSIFAYIYHKNQLNVANIPYMDGMGYTSCSYSHFDLDV